MKEFFTIIGVICLIIILGFGLTALNYGSLKFWGPKYENARREIFENTKSFRDGSSRDLDNLRLQYLQATDENTKAAIKDTMRHRAFGVPREQLSPEVLTIIYGDK
jgi:hypothetical protein